MNILSHFNLGAARSFKLWKWILVIWFISLILVSILALTLRGELNTVFGKSMITEKLTDRTIVDAIANSGTGLHIILSSFSTGFFLISFLGILVNVFFNGGLFVVLRNNEGKPGSPAFFTGAASNFWSFLLIWLIVALMISFLSFLLIGLPVMARIGSGSGPSVLAKVMIGVMLLIIPVFLLVADYARVWQASKDKKDAFKAIGQGFKNTFRNFISSWSLMFILFVVQLIYVFIVFYITGGLKPTSSGGIFLLFVLIQVLFIIRLFLRAWRYGSVVSLYEKITG
jgi:hypothetical protein